MRLVPALLLALACSGDDGKSPTDEPTPTVPTDTGDTGTPTNPNDRDRDGVAAPIDCNDADPTVFPGAPEHCDGVDSDCDGRPDVQIVTVGTDRSFESLADAAPAILPGDTVVICPGVYTGSATIDAPATLTAFDPSQMPTLDAQGAGTPLIVDALDVRVESLRITGGTASGVLATLNGSVELVDCVIEGNIGAFGAGVQLSQGGGTIERCTIADNIAQEDGGGVYAAGVTVIRDTVIRDNVASSWGGGVTVGAEGALTLDGVDLDGNTAERGGGVFALAGTTVDAVGETTIHDNTASDAGGGVYLWTTAWTGGLIDGNDAVVSGGGVYVFDGGAVAGVEVRQNRAANGGGMLLRGAPTLDGVVVANNDADALGGGVYLLDADVVATDLTVTDNEAPAGGGAVLQDSSLAGGELTGNTADNGGGIYLLNVDDTFVGTLSGVAVNDNVATTSGGGAYLLADVDVLDATFRNNLSSDRAGGVYVSNEAEVRLERVDMTGNAASERGGGLYSNDLAEVDVRDSTIDGNQALRGAGCYINGDSRITLTDSAVTANGDPTTISGGGARLVAGELVSVTTDWGVDATENTPDDVFVEVVGGSLGYGVATFACDLGGCSPAP